MSDVSTFSGHLPLTKASCVFTCQQYSTVTFRKIPLNRTALILSDVYPQNRWQQTSIHLPNHIKAHKVCVSWWNKLTFFYGNRHEMIFASSIFFRSKARVRRRPQRHLHGPTRILLIWWDSQGIHGYVIDKVFELLETWITGWWLGKKTLWKIWLRQLGWLEIPNISGKMAKNGNQTTTNQIKWKTGTYWLMIMLSGWPWPIRQVKWLLRFAAGHQHMDSMNVIEYAERTPNVSKCALPSSMHLSNSYESCQV